MTVGSKPCILLSEGSSLSAREAITSLGLGGHAVEVVTGNRLCLGRFSRFVHRVYRARIRGKPISLPPCANVCRRISGSSGRFHGIGRCARQSAVQRPAPPPPRAATRDATRDFRTCVSRRDPNRARGWRPVPGPLPKPHRPITGLCSRPAGKSSSVPLRSCRQMTSGVASFNHCMRSDRRQLTY